MNEDGVSSGVGVGMGARKSLVHSVASDQRLDPCDEDQVVAYRILHRAQPAGEFVGIGKRMPIADERIHLGKALVLQRDAGSATLLQLACQKACIVEIAKAAITVDKHRKVARVHHAFDNINELGPGGFIGVAVAERARNRQAGRPESLKTCTLGDGARQTVVSLHQEGEIVIATDLVAKFIRRSRRSVVVTAVCDDGLFLRLHVELLERPICIMTLD